MFQHDLKINNGRSRSKTDHVLSDPRVRFPGAVNSKFTTEMAFLNPSESSHIPTYRVMDSDGVLVDKDRKLLNASNEEILTWYKNMLSGWWFFGLRHCWTWH